MKIMNQPNQQKKCGKHTNFFPAPHRVFDDEAFRNQLSHADRDFYIALCHLFNRHANEDGWFRHIDGEFKTLNGKRKGFFSYGFGSTTCKRARKKLVALGLIEIKENPEKHGRTGGTMYRIRTEIWNIPIDQNSLKNRPP